MIGASKILTVSYGTFSCTLEGFDEPFNTMKAIAEYFRDLAAEDRYFGAEPPTPDAAMLHKIAEREIHRRVEAKIQENGVILRAGDALEAPAFTPAKPSVTTPADLIDYDDQPLLSDASASADSVAAKLSRLRATAATLAAPAVVAQSYEDEQPAGAIAAIAEAPLASEPTPMIAKQTLQIEAVDQVVDLPANEPAPAGQAAVVQARIDAVIPTHDELIADDAQIDNISDQFDGVEELPDHVDTDSLDDLAHLDGDFAEFEGEPLLDEGLDQTWLADDEPAIEDSMSPADAMAEDTQAADDAMLASLGALIEKNDQSDLAILDDDFEDEFDDVEDSFAADEVAVLAVASAPHDDIATVPDVTAATLAAATPAAPAEPEMVQRARARVIKIRRADAPVESAAAAQTSLLSAEAEAALQAELAALEAEADPAPTATHTQPLIEIHDDLAAELDQISTEIGAEPIAPVRPQRPVRSINVTRVTADVAATAAGPAEPQVANSAVETYSSQAVTGIPTAAEITSEPRHTIETDLADDAVGRLMAQTNSALDGVDVKRRQAAIAHLKGAVAATEADRMIAPNQPVDDLTESYRSDLESVVRPMRPAAPDARMANADRPQPLVLVSAQRIDRLPRSDVAPRPEAVPRFVAPVRPRRIAVGAMAAAAHDSLLGSADDALDEDEGLDDAAINMFAETESFADFADRLGASDLPDLLEAAAVYCAAVLGRPEFSRPLVLRQIATLPATADLSREDGLRVFGTLMRQGRIAKTRRGQFAVTDRSPILAEALRSAG